METPTLISLNFSKEFLLYTFFSNSDYVVVLTQNPNPNTKIAIAFMRSTFNGVDINYASTDKQDFVVYKEVKHFCLYLVKIRLNL